MKLLNDQRFCEISPEVGENLRWDGLVIMFYHPCIVIGHCTQSTETSDKLWKIGNRQWYCISCGTYHTQAFLRICSICLHCTDCIIPLYRV